jgi:hypothetical protein
VRQGIRRIAINTPIKQAVRVDDISRENTWPEACRGTRQERRPIEIGEHDDVVGK